MISRTPLSRFEAGAYLLLIAGIVGDHLSTSIGLAHENIYESNPLALAAMQNGLWIQADSALIILIVGSTYYILRSMKNPSTKYMLLYPIIAGLIRLAATISNIQLFF